jgi:diguanylate cyclase (GGDEF)-like protein
MGSQELLMNEEAGGPERILVADDEEIIREMLFSYLTEEGYLVDIAKDGTEAVAKTRANRYHVVITDIRLPGANGMDILKSAKETHPDTEVIVMTAFSTEDLAIEAVRLGAYDYLKKPVDDLGLFALLIRQIIQKQALARENQRLVEDLQSRNNELNSANTKLMSMATTDPLTGACNRRYILARLDQQFQQTMRYGEPFALLIMDIDHFKRVNDTYGHQVGDDVLRHFVDVIRKLIRGTDLFGRYGGEEFLLILHGTDPEDAQRTADRLRSEVARTPCNSDQVEVPIPITVSMGLITVPCPKVETVEDVVKAADAALYRAKAGGRNCVVMAEESAVATGAATAS